MDFFHFEFPHLLSLADVSAEVTSHLLHGPLCYDAKRSPRKTFCALRQHTILVVGRFRKRHSVIALDVAVGTCHDRQESGGA